MIDEHQVEIVSVKRVGKGLALHLRCCDDPHAELMVTVQNAGAFTKDELTEKVEQYKKRLKEDHALSVGALEHVRRMIDG